MSMSDCDRCWSTPCECGYDYETWDTARVGTLHALLGHLLQRRARGEQPRPLFPARVGPPPTRADYERTIEIPLSDAFPKPR